MNLKRRLFWLHVLLAVCAASGVVCFALSGHWWNLVGPMLGPSLYVAVRIWWWRQDG